MSTFFHSPEGPLTQVSCILPAFTQGLESYTGIKAHHRKESEANLKHVLDTIIPKIHPQFPDIREFWFGVFGLVISPLSLSHSPANSLAAQVVKNKPAMWETRVQSLH